MFDGDGTRMSRDDTEAVMLAGQNLPSESRALVPVAAAPHSATCHPPTRRVAAFLAHLIATARQEPQTRQRRCAEPAEAIAAYRDAIAKTHPNGVQ